jgi:Arc/MetJ family transcription regulator
MSVRQLHADRRLKVMPDDVHALCRGWFRSFQQCGTRRTRRSPIAERRVANCRDLERRWLPPPPPTFAHDPGEGYPPSAKAGPFSRLHQSADDDLWYGTLLDTHKYVNLTHRLNMRTNIDIDDRLMRQAMRSSRARTKRAVVEEALRLLIQTRGQSSLRRLRGKVVWNGDLDTSRLERQAK